MTKTKYWISLLAISVVLVAGSIAVSPIAIADGDDNGDSDGEKVSVTAKMPGVRMAHGEVLVLLDTTGSGFLETLHVAINLPCDSENNPNLLVVAGIAGGPVTPVIGSSAEFTGFIGPKGTCVFHNTLTDLPAAGVESTDPNTGATVEKVTDVILINLSGETTLLPRYSVVTITGTYLDDDNGDD